MANTSSRTLRLLSLLQTHRYWPGTELAERLEVSARTLRRDVERLRELGYPVDAQRGVDGGYQLAAGAAMPPLLLDDEEAVALAIGLRTAAQASIAGIEESSIRALTKLGQVMPPRLRRRVEALQSATVPAVWGSGPTVDASVLTTVAQACRDEERLRFAYTAQSDERTQRHVEPHRVVSLGRRWYLVAFDLHRQDWRSFRLDRLENPAFVRASFANLATAPHICEALVEAPAATVRTRVGRWATVEEVDERRCRLRMSADNLDWPTLALGSVGAEFQVLRPPELVDHIREWAARFTRATRV
jgi:predicted DNA-binding transcriptional regulator YafY